MNRGKGLSLIRIGICALLLSFTAAECFAAEPTAQISISSATKPDASWALTDGNRSTKIRLDGADELNITLGEEVDSVYLIWDKAPSYTMKAGDKTLVDSTTGFLHEYQRLPQAGGEFTLQIQEPQGILCDIYFFKGTTPDWVQIWEPPYEEADMLLFPTHADDEHLYFGGTMPYYAGEKGLKVQLAYLTNHNGEPYRPHELLNGLWRVGVRAYPVISDFPDLYSESLEHAKTIYKEEEILAYQVACIRRFRPKVIVGHDVNGEYGHGVHRLNTHTLMQALEASKDETQFPDSFAAYGTWDVPKTYLHLYAENAIVMDWDIPLENFAGKTAFEMAVEGFLEHRSQQEFFRVLQSGPYDCRKFGLYRSTVGEDITKNDFFENIDLTPKPQPIPEPIPEQTPLSSSETAAPPPIEEPIEQPKDRGAQTDWLIYGVIGAGTALLLGVGTVLYTKKKRKK